MARHRLAHVAESYEANLLHAEPPRFSQSDVGSLIGVQLATEYPPSATSVAPLM